MSQRRVFGLHFNSHSIHGEVAKKKKKSDLLWAFKWGQTYSSVIHILIRRYCGQKEWIKCSRTEWWEGGSVCLLQQENLSVSKKINYSAQDRQCLANKGYSKVEEMSWNTQRPLPPNTEQIMSHVTISEKKEENGGHGRILVPQNTKLSHTRQNQSQSFCSWWIPVFFEMC